MTQREIRDGNGSTWALLNNCQCRLDKMRKEPRTRIAENVDSRELWPPLCIRDATAASFQRARHGDCKKIPIYYMKKEENVRYRDRSN